MSSLNRTASMSNSYAYGRTVQNHNGLAVKKASAADNLVRMTMAHMLWEKQFYVDGETSANILAKLVKEVPSEFAVAVAKRARSEFKLRHVPLLLMREVARKRELRAEDLAEVVQRPDEMSEFLSLYWKDKKEPLSNQVKKGLALAFGKFNEYSLAKWDKNSAAVSLRDVMFLTHPKPASPEQEALFKRVANKELVTPDTWETELSAGADKGETFSRLMSQKKLGALAFLRNLRNMVSAGVSDLQIRSYGESVDVSKVLPFRFIAAARIVPQFENMLEAMMFRATAGMPKLKGKTVLLVDVSGSMFGTKVSAKSDLDRFDAAAALAVLCREVCEDVEIFSFSNQAVRVPARRGFALVDAIKNSQHHSGTDLGRALGGINANVVKFDRCIVFTDEQSSTPARGMKSDKNYVLNVAADQNGLNHSDWLTISGFSEACLDYIQMYEQN
jgi:60 kDa SS-A/Ro ribonucleoprotein